VPTSSAPLLSDRALNRATLARQLLLERSSLSIAATVEHLVGLQAQTPQSWYVGLWSRLENFHAEDASELLARRELVRMSSIRGTIHLLTSRDAWGIRPLMQPAFDRILAGSYAKGVRGVDYGELATAATEILSAAPLAAADLAEALAQRWPDHDPKSLAMAAHAHLALVQVTPRGLWHHTGRPAHTTLAAWLGERLPSYELSDLVLRYLGAFGPASVADMQTWSGLAHLREAVEPLRPKLVVFRAENGRELFDLPDAPRPDPDTPAPPRFLYDYDNVALSHADRTRFISEEDRRALIERMGAHIYGGVTVDGVFAGIWRSRKEGRAKRSAVLSIELAHAIPERAKAELAEEGQQLIAFLAEDADRRDVEFNLRE